MRRWKKIKLLKCGDIHCLAGYSRVPKMPVIPIKKHLSFTRRLKRGSILRGLPIPNPNFSNFAFLLNLSANQELWFSINQAIDELFCF
jgi:hypothetical protein